MLCRQVVASRVVVVEMCGYWDEGIVVGRMEDRVKEGKGKAR